MSKIRKFILLLGFIVIPVVASLVTFLGLNAAGVIISDTTPLVYTVDPVSKAYDGSPLRASSATLTEGELKEGHRAQFTFSGEVTNVGEGEGDVIVKIVNQNNVDVTSEYSIEVVPGKLTVTKQSLSVLLDDCVMEYNGGELVCDNYKIVSGYLANGHRVVPTTSDAVLVGVNDELPAAEDFIPVIYDGSGYDVSSNYEIAFSIGQNVKIEPRKLVLKPSDLTETYNGLLHDIDSYEILDGSLVKGHQIEVTYSYNGETIERGFSSPVKNAQIYIENVRIYTMSNGMEVDVTDNYNLDYDTPGNVTIKKAQVEIELNDISLLSNGYSLTDVDGYDSSKLYTL